MDIEEAENRLFQLKQSMELLDLVTGKTIEEDTKLNIKAIETVLSELEKKECKYIRQDNDWIVYQCSNCKMDWVFEDDEPKDSEINYCPKCGAKITGVIELEEEE